MRPGIELQIDFSTPSWKIKQLISHMQEWCNQFPRHYTPNSTTCNLLAFKNQNVVSLSFYFEHAQNWQDAGGRWLRHNNFMYELKETCERMEIDYSLPPQPYENLPMDAPAESYNMGEKSSYGLEGLQKRKTYNYDDDERDPGGNTNAGAHNSGGNSQVDSGAQAGAAATLMFAADMG